MAQHLNSQNVGIDQGEGLNAGNECPRSQENWRSGATLGSASRQNIGVVKPYER